MKLSSLDKMLEATRLTVSGRLTEATKAIQETLQNGPEPGGTSSPVRREAPVIDGVAEVVEDRVRNPAGTGHGAGQAQGKGQFLSAQFRNAAGSRPYRLYVPGSYQGQAMPLIVMLHGCTQSPEDFAAGTRMNEAAEANGFLVAYPAQTQAANASKCWNWFNTQEQQRDQGEPSLIAGITREIIGQYAIDSRRVYVAGLSAGGAAAAIMGTAYPDLYAAIGVHSGLACGAASDMMSAFGAMRQGHSGTILRSVSAPVPAIVFHGDQDTTVHMSNGDAVIAQLMPHESLRTRTIEGRAEGGHAYSRTLHADPQGKILLEQWVVHGANHAWAGGSPAGSFTDPQGPDATAEMVRFFMDHPLPR